MREECKEKVGGRLLRKGVMRRIMRSGEGQKREEGGGGVWLASACQCLGPCACAWACAPCADEGGKVRDALAPGTSGQMRAVPAPKAKIEAPPQGHFFRDGGMPTNTSALTDGRGTARMAKRAPGTGTQVPLPCPTRYLNYVFSTYSQAQNLAATAQSRQHTNDDH
jgi:hypothetical protein